MTVVVGVAPAPIVNVDPPITAREGPTENVRPPAVTGWRPPVGPITDTPFGPIETNWPLTTACVGCMPGPMVNV
jgi:hypothetical protein